MLLYSNHFFIISNFINETNNKYFLNKGWKYDVYGDVYEDDYTTCEFIDLCLYESESTETTIIENEKWSYYPDKFGLKVLREYLANFKFEIDEEYREDQDVHEERKLYSNFVQDRQYFPPHLDNFEELHTVTSFEDYLSKKLELFEPLDYENEDQSDTIIFPNNNTLFFLNDNLADDYYLESDDLLNEHLKENDGDINLFTPFQWVAGDDDNYEFWYEPFYMHTKTRELHSLQFLDQLNFYRKIKNSEVYQDLRKKVKNSDRYKNTWQRMKDSEIVEFWTYFETYHKICKSRSYRKFYAKHFIENNIEMNANYEDYQFENHYDRSYYTAQSDDWYDGVIYEHYKERWNQ